LVLQWVFPCGESEENGANQESKEYAIAKFL